MTAVVPAEEVIMAAPIRQLPTAAPEDKLPAWEGGQAASQVGRGSGVGRCAIDSQMRTVRKRGLRVKSCRVNFRSPRAAQMCLEGEPVAPAPLSAGKLKPRESVRV